VKETLLKSEWHTDLLWRKNSR